MYMNMCEPLALHTHTAADLSHTLEELHPAGIIRCNDGSYCTTVGQQPTPPTAATTTSLKAQGDLSESPIQHSTPQQQKARKKKTKKNKKSPLPPRPSHLLRHPDGFKYLPRQAGM